MTSGETDLVTLLATMQPVHNAGEYVFCQLPSLESIRPDDAVGCFREAEGWTVILAKSRADALRLPHTFVATWITLAVHSSLAAVGLTAAVAGALAAEGIACNVVAAYHHDHLFVPTADVANAMLTLQKLSRRPADE